LIAPPADDRANLLWPIKLANPKLAKMIRNAI
jgi:hypothetical protein